MKFQRNPRQCNPINLFQPNQSIQSIQWNQCNPTRSNQTSQPNPKQSNQGKQANPKQCNPINPIQQIQASQSIHSNHAKPTESNQDSEANPNESNQSKQPKNIGAHVVPRKLDHAACMVQSTYDHRQLDPLDTIWHILGDSKKKTLAGLPSG